MRSLEGIETDRTADGQVVVKANGYTITPDADGTLRVDGVGPCGRPFPNTARVLEPTSANPALELHAPLGISGVAEILRGILAWQIVTEGATIQ
jgi:hypothetical protein